MFQRRQKRSTPGKAVFLFLQRAMGDEAQSHLRLIHCDPLDSMKNVGIYVMRNLIRTDIYKFILDEFPFIDSLFSTLLVTSH